MSDDNQAGDVTLKIAAQDTASGVIDLVTDNIQARLSMISKAAGEFGQVGSALTTVANAANRPELNNIGKNIAAGADDGARSLVSLGTTGSATLDALAKMSGRADIAAYGQKIVEASTVAKQATKDLGATIRDATKEGATLGKQWGETSQVMGKFGAAVSIVGAGYAAFTGGMAVGGDIAKNDLVANAMSWGSNHTAADYHRAAQAGPMENIRVGLFGGQEQDNAGDLARWQKKQAEMQRQAADAANKKAVEDAAENERRRAIDQANVTRNAGTRALDAIRGQQADAGGPMATKFGNQIDRAWNMPLGGKMLDDKGVKSFAAALIALSPEYEKQRIAAVAIGQRMDDDAKKAKDKLAAEKAITDQLSKQAAWAEKVKTPTEKLGENLEEIMDLMTAGLLTEDQAARAMAQAALDNAEPKKKDKKEKAAQSGGGSGGANLLESRFLTRGPSGIDSTPGRIAELTGEVRKLAGFARAESRMGREQWAAAFAAQAAAAIAQLRNILPRQGGF